METDKIVKGLIGGISAGFSIGLGFLVAQRMFGKWGYNHLSKKEENISEEIKKGVAEGVKEAKKEEQAAQFAAMNASQGSARRGRRSSGKMAQTMFTGFDGKESGFEGNPNKMEFTGEPTMFKSTPNGNLNTF